MTTPVNLAAKLATFSEYWQPRIVATFDGNDILVVKALGEFVPHYHEDNDDGFLVLSGRLTIRMAEGDVTLGPSELSVVPRGVQHQPVAEEETHLWLIEPTGTPNTGDGFTAAPRRTI